MKIIKDPKNEEYVRCPKERDSFDLEQSKTQILSEREQIEKHIAKLEVLKQYVEAASKVLCDDIKSVEPELYAQTSKQRSDEAALEIEELMTYFKNRKKELPENNIEKQIFTPQLKN